ncbi:MAG: hypothetical protein Q8N04_09900 [Nitrospira sp.]|nr:hypothetical protein [Nitrospira sp.]
MDAESLSQIERIVTAATDGLRLEMAKNTGGLRLEMAGIADGLRQEMAENTDGLRQEMIGIAGGLRLEMGQIEFRLGDRLEETKRHMGVLAEGLRHDVQLVAEAGQLHSERLADIRREVEMQARETRALLQLSYEQIQQRVEILERRVQLIEQRLGLSV